METPNSTMDYDNTTATPHSCSGADQMSLKSFREVAWWFSGLGQILICLVGLTANTLSIAVLSSRQMNSIFYRLLICLSVFDNIFLLMSMMECIRKDFGGIYQPFHTYAFVYVFYPLQNINMCCCIYITVALSMERYLAVSKPVEYHNAVTNASKLPRIMSYVCSVVIFSILFNVPKFLELRLDITNGTETEPSSVNIAPTELRLMDGYVVYYFTLARGLVTGIIPFVALVCLNYLIYMAVRRRRLILGPVSTAAHTQHAADENRQALMLCTIVFIFLLSHSPRNFISLYESINLTRIRSDYFKGCPGLELWILVLGLISQLLLSLNSALNFFLYCIMSPMFRRELGMLLSRMLTSCRQIVDTHLIANRSRQNSPLTEGRRTSTTILKTTNNIIETANV